MSKLSELKRATLEDFPGAPEWFETFLDFQNAFNEDVYGRINGDIDLSNTTMALVTAKCTHGEEVVVRNPLWKKNLRCIGMYPVNTDGLPVAGQPVWRNISRPGSPLQLGVTAQYLLPTAEQIELVLTTNSSNFTSGVEGSVVWSGVTSNSTRDYSTMYSWDGTSTITIYEAGLYIVRILLVWIANTTSRRRAALYVNGTADDLSHLQASPVGGTINELVVPVILSANDTLVAKGQQDSGGGLALSGAGSLNEIVRTRTKMTITRIRNLLDYEANVTFLVLGA